MQRVMPIVFTVLKSGGDFKAEHVKRLMDQLCLAASLPFQFVCLTDVKFEYPKVITIPLLHNWPGWWSKIEIFRFSGPALFFDLDTMFYGNIDNLLRIIMGKRSFYLLKSFRPPERGISGVIGWSGNYRFIYDEFELSSDSRKFRGDEEYINSKLKERKEQLSFVQDSLDGVYSWKRHCNGVVPEDCNILVFHGKPRPWETPLWQTKRDIA